jgi:phage-related holin
MQNLDDLCIANMFDQIGRKHGWIVHTTILPYVVSDYSMKEFIKSVSWP